MLTNRGAFERGALAGIFVSLGAIGVYWFISPGSQTASSLRVLAVAVQAFLGFGVALMLWLRERRRSQYS
jgi:hypothetical protein